MIILSILFYLFLLATWIQLAYWLLLFSRLAFQRLPPTPTVEPEPVSLIICAHNEAENLVKNLPYFLAQDYPLLEIIVVNDFSSDKSFPILLEIQKSHPILRLVSISADTPPGKKAALTKGIKAASFDLILLSDADCRPNSPMWVGRMQAFVKGKTEIGLGYGPYFSRGNGILNAFIRFETVYTACQYFSFAFVGLPYMGVGRNLMYRKYLFYQVQGFAQHQDLASGDDDLFINQVATKHNTQVILSPDSFVFSEPKSSWRGYYRQKARHISTGRKYRLVHRLALGSLAASHFGHYVLGIVLLLNHFSELTVFVHFLVRIGVVLAMYAWILPRLQDRALLRWVPIFDALYIVYYLLFAPVLTGKKEKWNWQ